MKYITVGDIIIEKDCIKALRPMTGDNYPPRLVVDFVVGYHANSYIVYTDLPHILRDKIMSDILA